MWSEHIVTWCTADVTARKHKKCIAQWTVDDVNVWKLEHRIVQINALDKKEKNAKAVLKAELEDGIKALDIKEKNSDRVLQAKTEDGLTALDKKEKETETVLQARTEDGLTVIQAKIQDGLTLLETREKDIKAASQDSYEQTKNGK